MSFGYPVFLNLDDVSVLVVGGGEIAFRKASGLASAGALVTVVAPEVKPHLIELAHAVHIRPYQTGESANYRLVITATNDPAVNAQVCAEATQAGVWANSADDPNNCSFILPAVTRQGDVTVAVSTGGASPALASHLRTRIGQEILTPQVAAAAIELARQRAEVHAEGASTEDIDWSDRVRAALTNDPEVSPGAR
jgi:precorrin-2 dehydrogenase / sirohydrochlorin ferrochelatase